MILWLCYLQKRLDIFPPVDVAYFPEILCITAKCESTIKAIGGSVKCAARPAHGALPPPDRDRRGSAARVSEREGRALRASWRRKIREKGAPVLLPMLSCRATLYSSSSVRVFARSPPSHVSLGFRVVSITARDVC